MSDDERGVDVTKDPAPDTETEVVDSVPDAPGEEYENDGDDDAVGDVDESSSDDLDREDEAEVQPVEPAPPKRNSRRNIWRRQITVKPVPVILIVLVLLSGGVTAWLYTHYHQPDQRTSPSVARAAIKAASDGTVALLSYAPDSLDKDFASARSHLSGDFLSYYDQFTQQIVAPAAKQKQLKTSAHVMRAGMQELHPDSAVVLVFVNQSTTSKDNPEPSMAASSALVNLSLVDGKWLITKFTPV